MPEDTLSAMVELLMSEPTDSSEWMEMPSICSISQSQETTTENQ